MAQATPRTINLASYATDGPYSITCGTAAAADTSKLTSINRNGCDYTITAAAAAAQGDTTFTLTYTSSGSDTHDASFMITIGPASNIVFTAPDEPFTVQANSARGIDLSSYATDGSYTIGCEDATNIDDLLLSVRRNGCTYIVAASINPGDASFTVNYTSTGGGTQSGTINITITPAAPASPPIDPTQPTDPTAPTDRPHNPAANPPARTTAHNHHNNDHHARPARPHHNPRTRPARPQMEHPDSPVGRHHSPANQTKAKPLVKPSYLHLEHEHPDMDKSNPLHPDDKSRHKSVVPH